MQITVRSGPLPAIFALLAGSMSVVNAGLQRDATLSGVLYGVGAVLVVLGLVTVMIRSRFVVIDGLSIKRYGALGLFHRTTTMDPDDSLFVADNKLYLRRPTAGPKKLADKWMAWGADWHALERALDGK
jgi:hypothetical protein